MNAGLAALVAVLGCTAAAALLATVLALADRLRVTVTIGRARVRQPPQQTGDRM